MRKYMFVIAVLAGIILTGSVVIYQGRREYDKRVDAVKGERHTISYDRQMDLILANKEMWCFSRPKDAAEEMFVTEADYYYRISDMDQNGRLEIISSTTTGNGSIFSNAYYEVSEDGKELVELSAATSGSEEVLEPDLWDFTGFSPVYYDKKTETYHYPQWDHTHSSGQDTEDVQEDMTLSDGVVTVNAICGQKSEPAGRNKVITKYYAGIGKERFGETVYRYGRDWEADDPKQAEEYDKKLQEISKQYYEGMEELTVTFRWFQNINTEKYINSSKIKVIPDEQLREKMEESWESFGIHDMKKDAAGQIDNPYFPTDFTRDTEVDCKVNRIIKGKATMKSRKEQVGKQGMLYAVSWHDPRKCSSNEFPEASKSEKKAIKREMEEMLEGSEFYLWVTDTQIYYIPIWDTYDGEEDYSIMRLLFYNEIPEYACLVCQEEELKDSLEEMQEGEHQWIEKHPGDIRCYRSYTSRGEGYDTSGILQFVWKKGVGLVGYRSSAHPAGGFSTMLWRKSYVQIDDMIFTIDNE